MARADEPEAADHWWASVDHGSPEATVLAHHGYQEPLSDDQRLSAYRDHKKLTVISMTTVTSGYEYQLFISTSGDEPNLMVTGMITFDGAIHEASRRARLGG